MFPDSEIARRYSQRATKMIYVIYLGLAPNIQENLHDAAKKSRDSKTETLYHVIKEGLLDLAICYFDETSKLVQTVCFDSVFHVRSTA